MAGMGKNLTVQTETNSYHSLIVEAHGVSAALFFWILERTSIKVPRSYPVDCSLSPWALAETSNPVNELPT